MKMPLTVEQQTWLLEAERKISLEPNPCLRLHGADKMARKCKDCRLLMRKEIRSGKVFFKCTLRGNTNGPGTDHRANWTACAQFVPTQQRERTTAGHRIIYG